MIEKTVLIVEDNDLNMKLVKDLLKIDGIRGIEADNAENGLDLAKVHMPDLILMDIELPGMDGLSAVRILKEDPGLRDIPVLALTAYAMDNDRANAEAAGCDGYITKPINIKTFRTIMKNYLGEESEKAERVEIDYLKGVNDKSNCGKKILVVDDDPLNVKLLGAQLLTKGYQVLKAFNGNDAIRIVQESKPDLILLDIMMPEMDGYEVTTLLKSDSITMNIPIILVTALAGDDDKKKGLAAGADEFINKPIDYPELFARIISLLRLKEYQEQLRSRKKSEELIIKDCHEKIKFIDPSGTLPTVLIVDDDPVSMRLMQQYLSGIPCNIETAFNGEDAVRTVEEKKVDVILLDLLLPSMNGFDVCRKLKESEESYPVQIVMVTNLTDTASKIKAVEAGTDDFLIKPVDKDELKARMIALFKKKTYLDQLIARVDTALNAAITDELTGIFNHGYFKHFLNMEFTRSERHDHRLALLMIDIDNFKDINDRYGHPYGDRVLKSVASILQQSVRKVDFLARYGGEEFAVILPYVGRDTAGEIAERLREKVNSHSSNDDVSAEMLSISIGVSMFPETGSSPEELIRTADAALYMAKRNGKNRVEFYSEYSESEYNKDCCGSGLL